MAQLQADLELNISEALTQVEQLGAELEATIESAGNAAIDDISIGVEADTAAAEADLAGLEAAAPDGIDIPVEAPGLPEVEDQVQGLTDSLEGLQGAAAGVAAVGLGAGLSAAIGAFGESELVIARIDQFLANAGSEAVTTSEHIQDLALSVQEYSGVSDETVATGAGLLLTFENLRNASVTNEEIFDRTTRALVDLAASGYGTVESNAKSLGRALEDPAQGLQRLARQGITFTEQQREQIIAMQESGDVLGAQSAILDEIEDKYGGVAAAAGGTLTGSIDRATESFGNFLEVVGGSVAQVLDPLVSGAASVGEAFTDLPVPVQNVVGALTGFGLVAATAITAAGALQAAMGTQLAAQIVSTARAVSTATIAFATANPVIAGIAAVLAVAGLAYIAFAGDADEAAQATEEYTQALRDQAEGSAEAVNQAVALQIAESGLADEARTAGVALSELAGSITGQNDVLPQLKEEYDNLTGGIGALNEEANRGVEGAQEQLVADQRRIEALAALIGFIEEETGALGASSDALDTEAAALEAVGLSAEVSAEDIAAFVDSVTSTLPGIGDAFSRAQAAGEAFGQGIAAAADPEVVGAQFEAIAAEILAFGDNLRVLGEAGFADLAGSLAQLGPDVAGPLIASLADAVRSGTPEVLEAFAEQAASIPGALEAITPTLEALGVEVGTEGATAASTAFGEGLDFSTPAEEGLGEFQRSVQDGASVVGASANTAGQAAAESLGTGFALAGVLVQGQMSVATALLVASGVLFTQTATQVGTQAGAALGRGFATSISPGIQVGLSVARVQIAASGASLSISAASTGRSIGRSLGDGISQGIRSSISQIANAARDAVNEAEAAARAAADSNSPSRLFAAVGSDMGEGLVLGFEEATAGLISAAEGITYAAAAGVTATGASAAAAGSPTVNAPTNVNVIVQGDATPENARLVRDGARDGVMAAQRQLFDIAAG